MVGREQVTHLNQNRQRRVLMALTSLAVTDSDIPFSSQWLRAYWAA